MIKADFESIVRTPDFLAAFGRDNQEIQLIRAGSNRWIGEGVEISTEIGSVGVSIFLRSDVVSRIQLRWNGNLRGMQRFLGDHWERSYADLEWRGSAPNRVMPWYFLAYDGQLTHGFGVRTGTGSMCFWTADPEGVCLWADVRSGGLPVQLGERTLCVAELIYRRGTENESPFEATKEFCRQMCPTPSLPSHPVYGTNDWNYAYGNNSADLIAVVSGLVSELSPDVNNRPYSVIDEGWAMGPYEGNFGHGPWEGNPRFGDMATFADRLKGLGVRPGIWFRPLTPLPETPADWRLSRNDQFLDPSHPEVLDYVAGEIRKLVGWGYEMIKHDFTTWDLFGSWGFEMGPSPTRDGWHLNDRTITNAEALTNLYRVIRGAAGETRLIGCNTVGHLAAGFHEVQRIGDDTSGRSWNRNRRMGVNTLAFRAPQHGAFFDVDPDIVALTQALPWNLAEQWLRLVSESGTALFVAVEPGYVEPHHRRALARALTLAAKPQPIGEPLDWMDSLCPRQWKLLDQAVEFDWIGQSGPWPFPD